MGLIERLMGKPARIRATPISDALSFLVAEEKTKSDERLTGMRNKVQKTVPQRLEAAAFWRRKHLHSDSRKKGDFGKGDRW